MVEEAKQNQVELSPQEAEAVLELWAKKQAEGELRTRLNVQDLAEAMSLPISEVEKMVDAVRQKPATPVATPPLKAAKPINKPLIALVAVVWFAILAGACYFAFEEGTRYGRHASEFAAPPPPIGIELPGQAARAVDTMEASLDVPAIAGTPVTQIPRSVQVEMKGYKVYGEQRTNANEGQILDALRQIVNEVAPTSSAEPDTIYGDVAIINALQASDPSKVNGQIQFEAMTIQGKGVGMTQLIPIAKVSEANLVRLVKEEQAVRLKILANWAFNQRGNAPLAPPRQP